MSEFVLLGDEAVALAAIHSGVSSSYGYPGTPSTEILEYILDHSKKHGSPFTAWCANEKTAYEEALGTSFAGKRSLVTMKHVGLNVAADPFMNSALLDLRGGLVLAVADDPGMHSSQNEQDSRYYADFARIVCLEPRNQQEAYDMTREAFDISERFGIPVMVRLVTRLSHARAKVITSPAREENPLRKADRGGWMLLPALARRRWDALLDIQKDLRKFSEESDHNRFIPGDGSAGFGLITTGLARNYYEENKEELPSRPHHLHISAYPAPAAMIASLASSVKRLVVLEEGYPFVERYLRGFLPYEVEIVGKEDGAVPRSGELNPDNVRPVLGLPARESRIAVPQDLPGRPPQFCAGCPHADTFTAINTAAAGFELPTVTSDIGCYALGALPPYSAVETIIDMGASISVAKGAADAGLWPVVATIGDSTFLHSGLTPLIDAVSCGTDMTVVILDNSTVAMTGGQQTILPGEKLAGLVQGLGVDPDHVKVFEAHRRFAAENTAIIRSEMEYHGLSVVIAVRECVETAKRKREQ